MLRKVLQQNVSHLKIRDYAGEFPKFETKIIKFAAEISLSYLWGHIDVSIYGDWRNNQMGVAIDYVHEDKVTPIISSLHNRSI